MSTPNSCSIHFAPRNRVFDTSNLAGERDTFLEQPAMTADVRMSLEEELDHLSEDQVESWVRRCFEACDPRYESDWLNGLFELALMQFPDNYEVRAAASKAATLEAQRLYDEGDTQEAVSRLERLLESDPYCTEAFEMLERFMQGSSAPEDLVPEPVLTPPPAPLEPAPAVPELPDMPDLDLDLSDPMASMESLEEPMPVLTLESPPEPEPVVAVEATPDAGLTFLDEDLVLESAEPEAPAALLHLEVPEPAPEPPPSAPAPPEPAPPEPVVTVVEPTPPPPPVVVEAPPPAPPAAPVTPVAAPQPAAPSSSRGFEWRSLIGLPAHSRNSLEPQLEQILPSLTERFRQVGNFRSLVFLLTDLYQREPGHTGVANALSGILRDWCIQLEQQGRGPEAGQVAAWSAQLLGPAAAWSQNVIQKYPAQLPSLPDLGPSALGSPAWMSWVAPLREQPGRYEEAGKALSQDPQSLQSLFRHLAVHHPNHAEHVLNLGWAYSITGQHALAMVHTQRSLQLQASARGYQLLQAIYHDLGQPDMAQRVAQQLAQLRG